MGDLNLNAICAQRRLKMLFPTPPIRYDLTSPYPSFTQSQLDMRRKAEILQYAGNKTNTKTNNITKAERYAQVISGKYQSKSYATVYELKPNIVNKETTTFYFNTIPADINCPADDMLPTPTSSSGVPGPIINLVRDTSVPLYNYAVNNISYSIINNENVDQWRIYSDDDLFVNNDIDTHFLYTSNDNPNINSPTHSFDIQIPFSIYIQGYNTTNNVVSLDGSMSIAVTSISTTVYYNSTLLPYSTPTYSFSDASSITVRNISNIQPGSFYSATVYSGLLTISNIQVLSEPFVYDVKIKVEMTPDYGSNDRYIDKFSITNYGLFLNATSTTNQFTNCSIVTG